MKGEFCRELGANMVKDKDCMDFCNVADNKAAYCDSNMVAYCKSAAGQTDQICDCINSTFPGQQGPECFDPKCKQAYMTSAQTNSSLKCPTCSQYVSGEGSGYFQQVDQKLICDGKEVNANTINKNESTNNTTNNNETKTNDNATNESIGFLVFSCIFCCCFIFMILLALAMTTSAK